MDALIGSEQVVTSVELGELAAALSKMQGEVGNVAKTSDNPFFKSKYADLASVWDAIREPLASNGLSLVQLPVPAPSGMVGLHSRIMHKSGQYIGSTAYVPVKNDAQGYGSGLTYLRRYMAQALTGVAPEDDDGNGTVQQQPQRQQPRPQPIDLEREQAMMDLRTVRDVLREAGHPQPPLTSKRVAEMSTLDIQVMVKSLRAEVDRLQEQETAA
jgi:hypothetical protein